MTNTQHGIECESGRLAGASYGRFETRYPVRRFYDDGSGPVWIYQDAGGLLGIVRASSWEKAWAIVKDEILDDAPCECPLMWRGHGEPERDTTRPSADCPHHMPMNEAGEYPELPEGCGYRNSGNGSNPWNQTAIYCEDSNGSELRLLTYADIENHGIRLTWEEWDHEDSAE